MPVLLPARVAMMIRAIMRIVYAKWESEGAESKPNSDCDNVCVVDIRLRLDDEPSRSLGCIKHSRFFASLIYNATHI